MTQGTPPPVRAIPVGPASYAQLADEYSRHYGRPGVVTAIGVISIVVASLSLLANLVMGFQAVVFYSTSKMFAAVTAPPPAMTLSGSTTVIVGDEFLTATGLPAEQRTLLTSALTSAQALSEARTAQLDALLVDSGRIILPANVPQATSNDLRKLIKNSGRLPRLGGREGRVFFELTTGRLEIDDDNAVFFPADGSPTLRTTGPAASVPGSTTLSPAQVQAAVDQVQSLSGNAMTKLQRDAMSNALRQQWQMLITPASSVAGIRSQVTSATVQPDGSIVVTFSGGTCTILPQGAVKMDGMVLATATGGPINAMPSQPLSASIGAAMVNVALAVALLVLGILVLRQTRSAGRWLKVWSVVKLLGVIGGALAWWAFYRSMFGAWGGGVDADASRATALSIVAALAVAGAAWPIVLLILLHRQRVREYYAPTT